MRLLKLSYTTPDWELKDLELNDVNLIVAKNATGKSRTLLTLNLLITTITQKKDFDREANWEIEFIDDLGIILNYKFSTYKDSSESYRDNYQFFVESESLYIGGENVLERTRNIATLKNVLNDITDEIAPPSNKLVLHTNRDIRKYPFLENIANWAENSFGTRFGNIMPYSSFNPQHSSLLNSLEDTPLLFQSLNEDAKKIVLKQVNASGYSIANIRIAGQKEVSLMIQEIGVDREIPHYMLAQGMYRNLSLVIFLEYIFSKNKPEMLIIDDLCEGLDFERAKKLGELIFNRCIEENIQLIATSNDSFLMEVVDIKYWNVLTRKGKVVTALNYKNSQKIFDDFRFTGLSNFDFFSSDFVKQN